MITLFLVLFVLWLSVKFLAITLRVAWNLLWGIGIFVVIMLAPFALAALLGFGAIAALVVIGLISGLGCLAGKLFKLA